MKKRSFLIPTIIIIGVIAILPPIQTAPFTLNNKNWDGISKFKELIQNNMKVADSSIPLRLTVDAMKYDVIVIVGGNLPYFTEDSSYLYQYVKQGGNVMIFEDHGYARILTSAFGISLGGTVIDQDFHHMNPYQPVINQTNLSLSGYDLLSHQVIFNNAVRVQESRPLLNTTYFPLFNTHGNTWEDSNHDGKFYRENERVINQCFLGGLLDFNEGGKLIVIGDSAFPTNDLIDQKENREMLSDLLALLASDGAKSAIFDESRKIWIPPTGKAAFGTVSVLIMGLFHSPVIAISIIIIIGGLIGIRKDEQIINNLQNLRKSFHPKQDIQPVAAFIQSEEEEELARLAKSQVISDLYRSLLADEIRSLHNKLNYSDKIELEYMLRQRYIDIRDYNKLLKKLEQYGKDNSEIK
ncbi:MAG: hypothetical protein ACFFAU_15070 [Candidatus Hodarchaeota archaeon]